MYAERRSAAAGAVLWTDVPEPPVSKSSAESGSSSVLPDGCMDLIWIDGALLVAGPDTRPWPNPGSAEPVVGLRFPSGVGPAVLGVPAAEVRNARARLVDLWPRALVRRWEDQLARRSGSGLDEPGATLEALARTVVLDPAAVGPVRQVARLAAAGGSVGDLTAATGWSERTLHRRCLHSFGYGANTLSRVLRFRRATGWIADGVPLADVAARGGYADQAHLSREVRQFAGRSPTTFRSA